MGFHHVETTTTSAPPEAVWSLWSDPATWATWDPPVEQVVMDGPFRTGTTGTMVMAGGFETPFVVETVTADERYVTVLTMGELQIRIDHLVEPLEDGARVVVTTDVEGPGADDVGAMVTAEAPAAVALLTGLAEGTRTAS